MIKKCIRNSLKNRMEYISNQIRSGSWYCLCILCLIGLIWFKTNAYIYNLSIDHVYSICGKGFVINFELSRHMRTHTGQKPYACQFCDRKFSDFGSRIKHERYDKLHLF